MRYALHMIQSLGNHEAGNRLGATKEASNPIGWSLTKVARNRVTRATLYKICFLGLGQFICDKFTASLCGNKIMLQGRETLRHEGQKVQKFVLEKNSLGMWAVRRSVCRRNYRHFGRK